MIKTQESRFLTKPGAEKKARDRQSQSKAALYPARGADETAEPIDFNEPLPRIWG